MYRPGSSGFFEVVTKAERDLSHYFAEVERILSATSHREPLEELRALVAR